MFLIEVSQTGLADKRGRKREASELVVEGASSKTFQ